MKISHCETYVVAVPPPHLGGMYWIFVELKTDEGLVGVGEVYSATFGPQVVVAMIQDVFERYLKGQNPHHIERFWRECYSSGFTQRPDLSMMGVVSGLEMACWDIMGKAAGQPVHALLGGKIQSKLRAYTYLYPKNSQGEYDYNDPYLAAEESLRMVEQGFTALKFDPAGPYTAYSGHQVSLEVMDRCELFCQLIRKSIGSRADILFGTHGQMTPSSAVRLAKRLEKFDPLWFEEPIPPGQEALMASVVGKTSIPVAAGERLTTKYEFHRLLEAGVSILQMNLGRVGGLLEAKKIAGLAEVYGAHIAPHLYNGPVGAAASLQLASTCANFLIQESIMDFGGFHAEVLEEPLHFEHGYLIPSDKPGLGVALNHAALKALAPYAGKRLHLQMVPTAFDVRDHAPAKG